MLSTSLELMYCPACGGKLEIDPDLDLGTEVYEGILHCIGCERTYPIIRGMPHLFLNDDRWSPRSREAQGWVDYHKELGIYEQPEDAVDLRVPYYPEQPWISVARSFDIALRELASLLMRKSVVLDLGAGRGWAAKQFAQRGCRAFALDIVPDENVGLGRAWALMKHAGVYFEPIIADAENLPFYPDSFDLVFCAATLHHTSDLPLFMRNIQRVLKPGGLLYAINEPCIAVGESAGRVLKRDAASELRHGINEQRPNLLEYGTALEQAHFVDMKFLWPAGYGLSVSELETCARDLGAVWPGCSGSGWQTDSRRWGRFLRSRLRTLTRRRLVRRILNLPNGREPLMRSILLCSGGEVIISAAKTA